jgi:hypothetical protein
MTAASDPLRSPQALLGCTRQRKAALVALAMSRQAEQQSTAHAQRCQGAGLRIVDETNGSDISHRCHLRALSIATGILHCLRFTYVFENWSAQLCHGVDTWTRDEPFGDIHVISGHGSYHVYNMLYTMQTAMASTARHKNCMYVCMDRFHIPDQD